MAKAKVKTKHTSTIKLTHCDGCGKDRRDVKAMGRDSNGAPDAPDYCFVCRVESKRGKVFSRKLKKYVRV